MITELVRASFSTLAKTWRKSLPLAFIPPLISLAFQLIAYSTPLSISFLLTLLQLIVAIPVGAYVAAALFFIADGREWKSEAPKKVIPLVLVEIIVGAVIGLPIAIGIVGFAMALSFPLLAIAILVAITVLAVFLSVKLSLVTPFVVLEDASVLESISKSWTVTEGRVLEIFLALLVIGIITALILSPVFVIGMFAGNRIVMSVTATPLVALSTLLGNFYAYHLFRRYVPG